MFLVHLVQRFFMVKTNNKVFKKFQNLKITKKKIVLIFNFRFFLSNYMHCFSKVHWNCSCKTCWSTFPVLLFVRASAFYDKAVRWYWWWCWLQYLWLLWWKLWWRHWLQHWCLRYGDIGCDIDCNIGKDLDGDIEGKIEGCISGDIDKVIMRIWMRWWGFLITWHTVWAWRTGRGRPHRGGRWGHRRLPEDCSNRPAIEGRSRVINRYKVDWC